MPLARGSLHNLLKIRHFTTLTIQTFAIMALTVTALIGNRLENILLGESVYSDLF